MLTHWHPRRAIYDALKRGFLPLKVPGYSRSMPSIDLLIKAHSVLQFDSAHDGVKPTPRVKADWALNIKDRHIVALGPQRRDRCRASGQRDSGTAQSLAHAGPDQSAEPCAGYH